MELSDVRWVAKDASGTIFGYTEKPTWTTENLSWEEGVADFMCLGQEQQTTLGYTKADAAPEDSLEEVNCVVSHIEVMSDAVTGCAVDVEVATPTGPFVKHDAGKVRYTLLPPWALRWVAQVLTHGAKKYAADNWRKAFEPDFEAGRDRYMDAAYRHMEAVRRGEWIDEDSGLPHLACAIASLMFVLEEGEEGSGCEH